MHNKLLVVGFRVALACLMATGLSATPAFAADCGGSTVTRTLDFTDFNRLRISGEFTLFLTAGGGAAVELEGPEGVLKDLTVRFDGGKLVIRPGACDEHAYTVHATVKDLRELDLSGDVEVRGRTPLTAGDLELDLSGSVDLELELAVQTLEIDASGSTHLRLTGEAGDVTVDLSGSGELEAEGMRAKRYEIDASGSSELRIHATESVKAELSGSSDLEYRGQPLIEVDSSGSNHIRPL